MVQGRAAIEAMWKGILAEHVGDPKLTTLDIKSIRRGNGEVHDEALRTH